MTAAGYLPGHERPGPPRDACTAAVAALHARGRMTANRFPAAVDDAIHTLYTLHPDLEHITVKPDRGKWLVIAKRKNRILKRIEVSA